MLDVAEESGSFARKTNERGVLGGDVSVWACAAAVAVAGARALYFVESSEWRVADFRYYLF